MSGTQKAKNEIFVYEPKDMNNKLMKKYSSLGSSYNFFKEYANQAIIAHKAISGLKNLEWTANWGINIKKIGDNNPEVPRKIRSNLLTPAKSSII